MITTSQGAMDLLEKVRIDIQTGLAEVPLLYQPLYERINGPFPGGSVQINGDVLFDANVVFSSRSLRLVKLSSVRSHVREHLRSCRSTPTPQGLSGRRICSSTTVPMKLV
jgi:hypothetical protein